MSAAYKQRQGKGLHLPGRQRAARLLLLRAFLWWWSPLWLSLLCVQGGGLVAIWGSVTFHQGDERYRYWSGNFFMWRLSNEMEHLCICGASLKMWDGMCPRMGLVNCAFGSVCLSSRCIPRWHFCNLIKYYRMLHLKWKLDCCFQAARLWNQVRCVHSSPGAAPICWQSSGVLMQALWIARAWMAQVGQVFDAWLCLFGVM